MLFQGITGAALLLSCFRLIQARPDPRHVEISDKLKDFFKASKWTFVGSKASLKGPISLIVKHEYKVPLQMEFPLQEIYRDCKGLLDHVSYLRDGVYQIYDGRTSRKVYCDMNIDGGGWTVFQRRKDGSVDFNRGWKEYKEGFGPADGEYWLANKGEKPASTGNDLLHKLTNKRNCELRIDMTNWNGTSGYAQYKDFRIESEANGYRLHIGSYTGTAGRDSLRYHNGQKFSTKDRDNDQASKNCAIAHNDFWWFKACDECGLNGDYRITNSDRGVEWDGFPGGIYMKSTKMMLRCQ